MTQQKTVLILSYYWPPSSGSGVQRWLKFVKYLPQMGWKPVVITPENGTAPYYDSSLQQEVPEEAEVIFTGTWEPFALYNLLQGKKKNETIPVGMMGIKDSKSWFQRLATWLRGNVFVPDGRMGWYPFAAKAALNYLKKHPVDLIVTTGPPHSVHLAGLTIKKKTGIPWVADFRDPWHGIYYNASLKRTAWANKKDQRLENEVLQNADVITVVSDGMREMYAGKTKRIEVVLNGFDTDDMAPPYHEATTHFSLVHVGNFFPYMNVPDLWDAVQELTQENSAFKHDFKLRFTGLLDAKVLQQLTENQLDEHLVLTGSVKHSEATAIQSKANLLLFVIPNTKDNKLVVTGKIFEYLASGSEIVSIGNVESNVANILSKAGRSPMLTYTNKAAFKTQIMEAYAVWKANKQISPKLDPTAAEPYSRKSLTLEMSQVFDSLLSKK